MILNNDTFKTSVKITEDILENRLVHQSTGKMYQIADSTPPTGVSQDTGIINQNIALQCIGDAYITDDGTTTIAKGDVVEASVDGKIKKAGAGKHIVGTALSNVIDGKVLVKLNISNFQNIEKGLMGFRVITSGSTLNLGTDKVVICKPTANMQMTIPLATTIPNDGLLHTFYITHGGDDFDVKVQLSGSDKYPSGTSFINLWPGDTIHLGGYNDGSTAGWMNISEAEAILQVYRETNWAASNFSSIAAIPFLTTSIQNNSEIIELQASPNNTNISIKKTGWYDIRYWGDINSTGGITWTVTGRIRVAPLVGSPYDILVSKTRTGNYGNEDQSFSAPPLYKLTKGSVLQLRFDQNNLTGNMDFCALLIKTKI